MTLHRFSTDDNRNFWAANKSSYFGAKNAGALLFLCGDFVGTTILDAGAGDGSLLNALRERFPRASVKGVDLAPKDQSIETGDLQNLSCPSASFDTVFCTEVIEHVDAESAQAIITELARVLTPDGILILTTPFDERLDDDTVTCPECNCSFHRYGHQQRFIEDDLQRLVQAAGLSTVDVFPAKMSRVQRWKFLGRRIMRSGFMHRRHRGMRGKRSLISISRKTGGDQ